MVDQLEASLSAEMYGVMGKDTLMVKDLVWRNQFQVRDDEFQRENMENIRQSERKLCHSNRQIGIKPKTEVA